MFILLLIIFVGGIAGLITLLVIMGIIKGQKKQQISNEQGKDKKES